MRAADPLALVVVGHPALVAAVDLHVGGVQIDRHRLAQRRRPLRRQRGSVQRGGGDVAEPGLHRRPLPVGEPAGQPGRGRRGQPGHRGQHLPGGVGALAVQPDQEVLPGQLRRGHPDQQLPAGVPAVALLDRPDRRVQPADHVQPLDQLGHRDHARDTGSTTGPARRSAPAAAPGGSRVRCPPDRCPSRPRRCWPRQPHHRRSQGTYRHLPGMSPTTRGFGSDRRLGDDPNAEKGSTAVSWRCRTCSAVTREDDPTMEWRSGYTNFNTSARPAVAAFGGQYHLFFKDTATTTASCTSSRTTVRHGVVHEISTSSGTRRAGRARSPRTNGCTSSSATAVAMTG